MRYDSAAHLAAWAKDGTFPKIHNAIVNVAAAELGARVVLDLGCSYGLLGARLIKMGVVDIAIGVDIDGDVLQAAHDAGVPITQHHLKIEPATFAELLASVRGHRVTAVLARRILPELFGHDIPAGKQFAHLLARAGVKEMVVEGRVISPSATNPLQSIDAEVAMLDEAFKEKRRVGAVSYLLAR